MIFLYDFINQGLEIETKSFLLVRYRIEICLYYNFDSKTYFPTDKNNNAVVE